VFVAPPKHEESFDGLRLATAQGEQQYIKGNTKFFAVALSGGGGPVGIFDLKKAGRVEASVPVIAGHSAAVMDFEFNPFHEHIIATGSEDTTIKVWGIPEDGLTETITEPLVDMHGHGKKVTLLRAHPTASNVLASMSADQAVKVWDIEAGKEMLNNAAHDNILHDITWDYTGKNYATSCKDKNVRIFDARQEAEAVVISGAHAGAKSVKLTFTGSRGKLITLGFTRQSEREIKVWDPRSVAQPLKLEKIDQASGVLIPFYDEDTSVVYLAGKGDGNVRYYEHIDEQPFIFKLSEYRSTDPAKGMCFLPKRGLDIAHCETARALKLCGSGKVEQLRFTVPRKSEAFQEDIYPPTFAGKPACTAEQWFDGLDMEPIKISLDPSAGGLNIAAAASGVVKSPSSMKTRSQLQKELDQSASYIATLIKAMEAAGLAVPDKDAC
jgi:coronin-1B/1C/6